jgi:hypothetical protein
VAALQAAPAEVTRGGLPLQQAQLHSLTVGLAPAPASLRGPPTAGSAAGSEQAFSVQVIALSATMGNVEELAQWLGGGIYRTTFRPVPLVERIKAGNELLDPAGNLLATLPSPAGSGAAKAAGAAAEPDSDHVVYLCQQALRKNQQVLIFCASKFACVQTCRLILGAATAPQKGARSSAAASPALLTHLNLLRAGVTGVAQGAQGENAMDEGKWAQLLEARTALVQLLAAESPTAEESLKSMIQHGIAYHNAGVCCSLSAVFVLFTRVLTLTVLLNDPTGLSASERGVVEKGFRAGHISILAATSTLAAGVNLPAGCVLVRSLSIGREFLNVMQYKQMCGRAGRMGQGGNLGESFLLVKASEKQRALQLSNQAMPDVLSQMHPSADGGNALSKALLEVVGLGLCKSQAQAEAFVQQTLLFRQSMRTQAPSGEPPVLAVAQSILNFLLNARILDRSSPAGEEKGPAEENADVRLAQGLKVTRLGRAIMQSNVNPDDAIVMYESLLRAQEGLHLETPLHLLYLVTPLEHSVPPDFKKLLGMYEGSRRSKNTVLADIFDAVGVDYALLNKWQVTPPSSGMLSVCTSAVKLHSIYATGGSSREQNMKNYKNVRKEEWRALTVCKRLWAAMALQGLLDGRSPAQLGKEFSVDPAEVDALRHGAQIMASKVVRFCEQVGWTAMERMLKDFQASLQLGRDDPPQLTELLTVPQMPRKIAKVLAENPNTNSVGAFVGAPAGTVVQLLQLSIGFELQVRWRSKCDSKWWCLTFLTFSDSTLSSGAGRYRGAD